MGLDMYLSKRTYFSTYRNNKNEWKHVKSAKITIEREYEDGTSDNAEITCDNLTHGIYIETPVAYWRKANAIHRWFLEHTGTEVDDCRPIEVRGDIVKELVDTCKKILADHSKAEELLPTQEGFFFGSTEYDEYYFDDIQDTIKQLENLDFDTDYIYEASW